MGAVLAMMRRRAIGGIGSRKLVLAGLVALAGCGTPDEVTQPDTITTQVFATLTARLTGTPQPDVRAALSRANIDAFGKPLLLAVREDDDIAATFTPIGGEGDIVVWQTPSGGQLMIRRGVVIATRAYGHDIASSDVDGVPAAIARGSGRAERVHHYLDGEGRMRLRSLACRYAAAPGGDKTLFGLTLSRTRLVTETCKTSRQAITNTYLFDSAGTLWESRQWFGPEVGMVRLTRLHR